MQLIILIGTKYFFILIKDSQMQSTLNNLKGMKVNFRNRKINLNLPKNQVHGALDHKTPQRERVQMDNPRENYIDSIADVINLIGRQYVHHLNQGKQQRFRAAILSNLTKLQARDRRIILQYNFGYNERNQAIFNFKKEEQRFKQWLGQVHFRIVSTSFDFQLNQILMYEQVKVYCSQNLLLNIILFIQKVQNRITEISLTEFMLFIDKVLHQNIEYLMGKYPQVKQIKPKKKLRAQVQPINNVQNDINDIFRHSNIEFTLNESQNYNSQIMRFFNYLIQKMTQKISLTEKKNQYPFAQGFFQIMQHLFQSTYIPQNLSKIINQKQFDLESYKKQITYLLQTNNQVKQYKEKVAKYSSYKMGMKLNPNTQLYTEAQIKAGFFEVKGTSILRILTKWIKQLERKIFQAKQYIQKRSFRFKNNHKDFSKLNASQKNDLYLQATKQVQGLGIFIKDIRQNVFLIQGQLAMTLKRKKERVNIPKHEYMVGQFSSKLQDAAGSSLLSYLNKIIHMLLLIPHNLKSKYINDQQLLKQLGIDLITFKISDLMRCKFSSHQNEVLRVYRQIRRISDEHQFIKIVRIKDRLDMGTRDILINVCYMDVMLCEIQLAVEDEIDVKQQVFDAFNHYLYELKRSNLGVIMESACIWAHYDQRSKIFKKINKKQMEEHYLKGCLKKVNHACTQPLVDNNLPFVCNVCSKFYFSQLGIIRHKKCTKCQKFFHCASCFEEQMSESQLKLFLGIDKKLGVFSQDFAQYKAAVYPKSGIIIPKKNNKVDTYFFTTVLWKGDAYIVHSVQSKQNNQNRVQVLIVIKNNQQKQWKKLKQNYIIYEWKQTRNINKTIKPDIIRRKLQKQMLQKQQQQKQLKEANQKKIQEITKKWKGKIKNKDKLTPKDNSLLQVIPSKSIKEYKSPAQQKKPLEDSKQQKSIKLQSNNKSTQTKNKQIYHYTISNASQLHYVRVAYKIVKNKQFQEHHYLLLGVYYKQKDIRAQLKKISNYKVIRQNLNRKMQVLFLEDLLIEGQLELTDMEKDKYSNSLSKINQVYLDSNLIQDISFLQKMPDLSVIHLNYNVINDMQSLGTLNNLTQIMFEYNKISQISGLEAKSKLLAVNLNHNQIKEIKGLQKLEKLETLTMADNFLQKIQCLNALQHLKKLDLSFNFIVKIQGLDELLSLQELDLSDNRILKVQNIRHMTKLKKLNLGKNKITRIQGLGKLDQLKFLDLHRNDIRKMQRLDTLVNLVHLNLAGNKIHVITGLKIITNVVSLNLSKNEISSVKPLIQNNLNNLETLDLSYNCIKKLIQQIFNFMPKLKQLYLNSNPLKMTKDQKIIYEKIAGMLRQRSEFSFYQNVDLIQSEDKDSDYEEQLQQKIKSRRNSTKSEITIMIQ